MLHHGGVEVLVRTLIEEASANNEVFLVSADDGPELAASHLSDRIRGHLTAPSSPPSRKWISQMVEWLRGNHIDLCHFHLPGTYNLGAGRLFACPMTIAAHNGFATVVTNHQAVSFFTPNRPACSFLRRCAAQAWVWPGKARQISAVKWEATVSMHDLELTRCYFPFAGDKLVQIYHSRLKANTPVQPVPPSRKILNVATIAYRKGQHILAEAFARIAEDFPEWSLDLVGFRAEAACVSRIEEIIRENRLENRLRMMGTCPDPSRFYQDAEIYVQPSLLEGLGLSLQEAMFHGRACVGADIGGIPELINDPAVGLLHRAGDPALLADALARLIRDPELRQSLGAAARASILERGMTRQSMSAAYQELYQQALNS